MAVVTTQSVVTTGTTPAAITPAASDTIAVGQFGSAGINMRVITTGTATDVSVSDAGRTPSGNAGTVVAVSCPATGVRMIFVPLTSVDSASGNATISFSGARTGVTYELYRV